MGGGSGRVGTAVTAILLIAFFTSQLTFILKRAHEVNGIVCSRAFVNIGFGINEKSIRHENCYIFPSSTSFFFPLFIYSGGKRQESKLETAPQSASLWIHWDWVWTLWYWAKENFFLISSGILVTQFELFCVCFLCVRGGRGLIFSWRVVLTFWKSGSSQVSQAGHQRSKSCHIFYTPI